MPRWYASSGSGEFANDRALTPNEIELLARWADDGAPYGDPPLVTRPHAPGKQLAPDLLLTVPFKHRIEAAAHTFSLATGLGETRWIRGWTFRPGNPALIASAVIALGPGKPLGTWVPGEAATFLPHGIAQRLPAGTDVTLTIHYRKPEAAAVDASSVGLYFAADSSQELAHLSLPCGPTRLRRSIEALGIRPRIGSSAWSLAVVARHPDGRTDPVASFQNYPGDHAQTYWFREPVTLRARNVHRSGRDRRHMRRRARIRGVRLQPDHGRGIRRTGVRSVAAGNAPAAAPAKIRSVRAIRSPSTSFWCPMHTHIRATVPGKCPECGMALVPMTPDIDGKYRLDASLLSGSGGTIASPRRPGTREERHRPPVRNRARAAVPPLRGERRSPQLPARASCRAAGRLARAHARAAVEGSV